LRESTSNALAEAQSLFREWNGKANDRIRASYAPRFVISCTEDLLKEVSRLAREQKAIIHTHASENRKEIELVKEMTGLENVEYLHHLGLASSQLVLAHCVWLNGREKEILHQTGTHVVHCPSSNMKLASGFSPIPELREKKINVALGADGAPCNNNLNMFQEMRMAALIHKPGSGPQSMRALEVLDMATRDGAKALNWLDDIGTLEVGKKADIVALDLGRPSNTVPQSARMNPEAIASSIVYSSQSEHVNWTLVDGQLCYQKGKGTRIPESDLMKKVHEAQEFIAQKVLKELQCP
jgi:cytosine/adenosine deaminase-related metal-dependent hydrolase